jgi:type IX secretion system PorP/SprF family membrane protein
MKKYILFLILGIVKQGIAQQQPLFTLYREQTGVINPAMHSLNYTSSDFTNTISATYRYQWTTNIQEAPVTQVFNWEKMIEDRNLLVGAYILNDKTGDIGNTSLYARIAYKLVFSELDKRSLTIGFNAGASRFYSKLAQYDAAILDKPQIVPDISLGAFYSQDNRFYVGVSTPQILNNAYTIDNTSLQNWSLKRLPHFYGVGGVYLDAPFLGNDAAYLEPNIWFRYIPAVQKTAIDVNLRAKISPAFWTGVGYNLTAKTLNLQTGSVLGESIGLSNGQLTIGFGFVVPMGQFWSTLGMGGDVHLSYSWAK